MLFDRDTAEFTRTQQPELTYLVLSEQAPRAMTLLANKADNKQGLGDKTKGINKRDHINCLFNKSISLFKMLGKCFDTIWYLTFKSVSQTSSTAAPCLRDSPLFWSGSHAFHSILIILFPLPII